MAIEADWEYLAQAKKPCQCNCHIQLQHKHNATESCCNCTNAVRPVLPGLSGECPIYVSHNLVVEATGELTNPDGKHSPRCFCHGTGRVPKPIDGFLLLAEMRKAGFKRVITDSTWSFYSELKRDASVEMLDTNDLAACVSAARKAVEARYGKAT